jgi:hypothetical protein
VRLLINSSLHSRSFTLDNIPAIDSPIGQEETSFARTEEISVDLLAAYERGKTDINFFAGLCMPSVAVFALPAFYIAVWQILTSRSPEMLNKLLRFALGLPRGHAKTTFIKVIICWLIVYDKAKFILIVCSNAELAENLLSDIHDILCSPNMTAVYGDWQAGLATDSKETKKAAYHGRSVSLVARGWSAGIRGLNLQNERPDIIFCDDVQTRTNDESPTDSDKLLKELTGTIFKAIAPLGNRLIIYVGNMYSEECILNKFKKSKSWTSMITGAILETGQPLWPALFSLEELMESYFHDEELGLAHIWFAEVMNDPQSQALSLLPKPLPDCDVEEILDPDGAFITIDPAGFRNASDDNVVSVHYKYRERGYVMESSRGIMDPKMLIEEAFRLCLKWDCTVIGVESVGYQQTLGFWLQHFQKLYNLSHVYIVELSPHGKTKESRIRLFIAELYRRNYFIFDPATRRDYVWQASMYKIGKKKNKDDLLDAIAYGLDIRNEFWHLLTPPRRVLEMDKETGVVLYNTPF